MAAQAVPPQQQTLGLRARGPRFGFANAALAGFVIGVVALMVVPLPTWLLDLLIASNLASSVAVLLVALYVGDALKIAAFPTLLLLTTLFRLALNVSSTRLILLHADAGEVIKAFGQFVVRGNYVVGAVIFLILTIIQFVVIAKGSERVAEVGARFTLDAMPGKQMAIDAELRSGSIDGNEARRRRRSLLRESQFYGAMDGAMKFVKGDVIASLIITIINVLGGLAIGVGQRDMEVGAALKRYGLLTIGDGLVTQIPALVMATAAGILVTRVASEEAETPLGAELASQIFGQPQALRVGSFFVFGLAATPGLPGLPFLVIGALMFAASRARLKFLREQERQQPEPIQRRPGPQAQPRFVPMVVPWSVEVSKDLEPLLDDDMRGQDVKRPGLRAALAATREIVFRDRGVPLPAGRVGVSETLPERHAVLSLHEVPALLITFPKSLADDALAQQLLQDLLPPLERRAQDFLGLSEVQTLLDELEQLSPASVRQVVPKPITLIQLTDILRRLVEERVSIRDLRAILEALSLVGAAEKDPLTLAEFVRAQLRRPITHSLTRGARELPVLLLDSHIEETVRGAITRTPAGSYLALAPVASRDILTAIRRAVANHAQDVATPLVLLTQPDIRRYIRKLLEPELPDVRVISFAELLPEVAVKPLGRATVANL